MARFPSRKAAADAAGISKDTWRRAEEGLEVWDSKLAQIDKALGWAVTSCIAIAEGGEPVLVDDVPAPPPGSRPTAGAVQSAVYEAATKALPGAAIGDLEGFAEEMAEVLRRAGMLADDE